MSYEIVNPILSGFYPDPSIIRVEDDFYMVTSSFSYYPGVPVFHSRDLAHWEQIGHVLDRPSQLPLNADFISGGIFAPTIRYHEGLYYMITTNVDHGGNFIVTATDPAGPWSEPHWIDNAEGIDPSLFWDDDGKAYYTGTHSGEDMRHNSIWISEIDLKEFRLVGEKKLIWGGAMVGAWCPEAPHVYKKDGWYYLMIAEGGTEVNHAVTIARSREIMGGYQGYDGNPIMTHRHLGKAFPIANTGHADLVELKDGSWYMVMLASRPYGGYHKNMGRETFIAPVIWEDGWPVVCPGEGKLSMTYPAANLPEALVAAVPETDDFDGEKLGYQWNYLGTPQEGVFLLKDSALCIKTVEKPMELPETMLTNPFGGFGKMGTVNCVGFVGRRQQHMRYLAQTVMEFEPQEEQSAGLILLQNNYHSLRVEMAQEDGKRVLRVFKGYVKEQEETEAETHENTQGKEHKRAYVKEICGHMEWDSPRVTLQLTARGQKNTFAAIDGDGVSHVLAADLDGSFLGSETAGGFVGAYVGMFASGNGKEGENYAAFDSFVYRELEAEE